MAESLPAEKEIPPFVPRTPVEQKLLLLKDLLAHQESCLTWYHRVGSKLIALEDAMRERGPGWFVALAKTLGISPSNLTKMRKFARDFKLKRTRMLENDEITWGMVTVVLHVSKKSRLKLLKEAKDSEWNLDDLKSVIKNRFGADHAGGRPLRRPPTGEAGLRQLQKWTQRLLQFDQQFWPEVIENISQQVRGMSAKERRQFIALLRDTKTTMRQLEATARKVRQSLNTLTRK